MRVILVCLCMIWTTAPRAAELPGDSLYRLDISLQTADGTTRMLSSLRGQAWLVTLFYSQCSSVCPLLTAQLQDIDRKLTPQARRGVTVLMVSLDATRDTPAALRAFKDEHRIDDPRWIVARADATGVRLLAAALGIRYRELPDHTFDHSSVVTLADSDGVIRASSTLGLRGADASFLQTVRSIGEAAAATRLGDERLPRPQ